MLGEIVSDERLQEFKITDNLCAYFFYVLQQAWLHPAQKFQRASVQQLLRGKIILFSESIESTFLLIFLRFFNSCKK